MKEAKKIIWFSIGIIALTTVIAFVCSQPSPNEKVLKQTLKKWARMEFKGKLNIKKFESSQSIGADYFEIYGIELTQSQSVQALKTIKTAGKEEWKRIERGYALITPPIISKGSIDSFETYYGFILDTTENTLEVQITQE